MADGVAPLLGSGVQIHCKVTGKGLGLLMISCLRGGRFGAAVLLLAACGLVAADAPDARAQDIALAKPAGAAHVALPAALPGPSPDCKSTRTAGERFRRPLPGLRRAVRGNGAVKVLVVGSSTTVGVGASSPTQAYVARLETDLEGYLKGLDFDVMGRGQSGEVAQGAADRMKKEVQGTKPDLVIWQVGTNDAISHVDPERFRNCLRTTLDWLAESRIDVVLVNPQYGDKLASDSYYGEIVKIIAEVASEKRVLLVDRFEAMKELSRVHGDRFYLTSDNLHMNDAGHRCMAEQLARGIVAGILMAEGEQVAAPPTTTARPQ